MHGGTVGSFDPPKKCPKCTADRKESDFYKDKHQPDGLTRICKECRRDSKKLKERPAFDVKRYKRLNDKDLTISKQPEKVQEILFLIEANPKITCEELGKELNLQPTTVRKLMSVNPLLRGLRNLGLLRMNQLVPKAISALEESLVSPAETVKFNAAVKVLEDQNVLGPQKIDIHVNSYENKSYEELLNMVQNLTPPPPPTLEAEVIS